MNQSIFKIGLSMAGIALLGGCLSTGIEEHSGETYENVESSRNSSDIDKPNYRPVNPGETIMKWTGIPVDGLPATPPPLQKTAAAGYIGFLADVQNPVYIHMDAENSNTLTSLQEPYYDNIPRPWPFKPVSNSRQEAGEGGVSAPMVNGSRDVHLHFSKSYMTSLPQGAEDYVVLRLSASCPTNGIPFARIFDNEDNNNHNSNSGNISPSTQSSATFGSPSHGMTRIEFCFVPSSSSGSGFAGAPWNFDRAGVFVSKFHLGVPYYQRACVQEYEGWSYFAIWSDDEDNGNMNSFDWYGMDPAYRTRALYIVQPPNNNGDYNTTMFFCQNLYPVSN